MLMNHTWTRISTFTDYGSGRAAATYRFVRAQPGWVSRLAILAFLIVIGLPILFLVMLAIATAVVVFGMLALINALVVKARGVMTSRHDGRENVRVIRRADWP